ncbi:solute carrier family 2, facilitated glucose transporter member 10 isoform X2 [Protopterus annectens]|uniref:solute carrier family 2, facilitated glucose transporter member 10 isoform X2 n=1 Tax=Protopterus annectens TaxID=7888 RepID=UPI001CFC3655|nr:solute carrier family 2, facilitated glucose transporter member 10 isoform X2 [Protopterus annectens]
MKMARTFLLLLSSVVAVLGGLMFGYEMGIISGAMFQLKRDLHLSCGEEEVLVSALLLGALLASLMGGLLIDFHGRRTSMLFSNMMLFGGSLIIVFSATFIWLVIGRIVIGFAISLSSMSCCIYISEIVGPLQRGLLVSLYEFGITAGILVSYAINYTFSSVAGGWKYMFGIATVPTFFHFCIILFLPTDQTTEERSDQDDSALQELIQVENDDGLEVKPSVSSQKHYSIIDLFRYKDNLRSRTFVGLGLVMFQQFTGQPNVLYYASTIFHSVGFQSDSSATLASVGLGAVKVAATLVAMACVDKIGRRILLIAGCVVMSSSMIIIGITSHNIPVTSNDTCKAIHSTFSNNLTANVLNLTLLNATSEDSLSQIKQQHLINVPLTSTTLFLDHPNKNLTVNSNLLPEQNEIIQLKEVNDSAFLLNYPNSRQQVFFNWITLSSMMVFVAAFSVGFGPITWIVLSEIYPAGIRGRAFAFANNFNWAANLIISLTFLEVIDVFGLSWTFLFYGFMAMMAALFIYIFLPETKGQSLEQISRLFSHQRFSKAGVCLKRLRRKRRKLPSGYQELEMSSM